VKVKCSLVIDEYLLKDEHKYRCAKSKTCHKIVSPAHAKFCSGVDGDEIL